MTPFGGSRPPGFQFAPKQGVGAGVAGLTQAEMTVLRGGTPARHVRSNSEGSCDYGEILATSTVPLQKAGSKHQSSSALDSMGRGGSGSITPSSGYITPRTGTATPIQPSSKVLSPFLFLLHSSNGLTGWHQTLTLGVRCREVRSLPANRSGHHLEDLPRSQARRKVVAPGTRQENSLRADRRRGARRRGPYSQFSNPHNLEPKP